MFLKSIRENPVENSCSVELEELIKRKEWMSWNILVDPTVVMRCFPKWWLGAFGEFHLKYNRSKFNLISNPSCSSTSLLPRRKLFMQIRNILQNAPQSIHHPCSTSIHLVDYLPVSNLGTGTLWVRLEWILMCGASISMVTTRNSSAHKINFRHRLIHGMWNGWEIIWGPSSRMLSGNLPVADVWAQEHRMMIPEMNIRRQGMYGWIWLFRYFSLMLSTH